MTHHCIRDIQFLLRAQQKLLHSSFCRYIIDGRPINAAMYLFFSSINTFEVEKTTYDAKARTENFLSNDEIISTETDFFNDLEQLNVFSTAKYY